MTDQLLPPNPSKDGWYWIQLNHMKIIWMWSPRQHDWWYNLWARISAQKAYEEGYRLASPHPIPTPEQLNALHALPSELLNWAHVSAQSEVFAIGDSERARSCGIKDTLQTTAAMLRAALGVKPDDPPGNGLDEIRAAAMDQWGVPRAGEETAP